MTYRILLSGGGTAGSVAPLIALADYLRQRRNDVEFLFLGSALGPERTIVEAANIPFQSIDGGKLRRYWSIKNISDGAHIWRGYRQASKIIRDWKPQVTVSAGSFISVPVMWAAHRQGVATLIHQQDVQAGLANRLMAPAADAVTVTFQSSHKAFKKKHPRWIGNPVRPEILAGDGDQGRVIFHLSDGKPVLLILGGATGAVAINTVIESLAADITKHWEVIHVTGPDRVAPTVTAEHYQHVPFLSWELPHALAVADVVISRAGLGAISELAALSKPSIFIPMPDTHQEANAKLIADRRAGIVLEQQPELAENLLEALEQLRQSPTERQRLGSELHKLFVADALPQFAAEVVRLLAS